MKKIYINPTYKERKTVKEVLNYYHPLVQPPKILKNVTGYVNKTFIIESGSIKFVLRESAPDTSVKHLAFETKMLDYLQKAKFSLTPAVIPNIKNQLVTIYGGKYYIAQNFLSGEWRASWNNLTKYTPKMLRSQFSALADFSKAVREFKFSSIINSQPFYNYRPLVYFAEHGEELYDLFLTEMPESPGKNLLKLNRKSFSIFIGSTRRELEKLHFSQLPRQAVHFDLHPGNLHFFHNKVTGIFDFDWARFDSRITDLAAAICQSCYVYKGKYSGKYLSERIRSGVGSYRIAFGKSEFNIKEENLFIQAALKAYCFYQLLFSMDWYRNNFKAKDSDFILKHFTKVILGNDFNWLFKI